MLVGVYLTFRIPEKEKETPRCEQPGESGGYGQCDFHDYQSAIDRMTRSNAGNTLVANRRSNHCAGFITNRANGQYKTISVNTRKSNARFLPRSLNGIITAPDR